MSIDKYLFEQEEKKEYVANLLSRDVRLRFVIQIWHAIHTTSELIVFNNSSLAK